MNNNNTSNATGGANNIISNVPTYDDNASNGDGGNQNVLDLTGNTQMIEDIHIGKTHTHTNMFVC